MTESQMSALTQSIRSTLALGRSIAIIGWKDSNHSHVTRSLPGKKFLFFENPPNTLGQNVGFVLFTKFVKHSDTSRLKERKDCHAVVLGTGKIKEIFESCKDVLLSDSSVDLATEVVVKVDNSKPPIDNDELLDYLTHPVKEKPEMSDIAKFQRVFF